MAAHRIRRAAIAFGVAGLFLTLGLWVGPFPTEDSQRDFWESDLPGLLPILMVCGVLVALGTMELICGLLGYTDTHRVRIRRSHRLLRGVILLALSGGVLAVVIVQWRALPSDPITLLLCLEAGAGLLVVGLVDLGLGLMGTRSLSETGGSDHNDTTRPPWDSGPPGPRR